MDNEKFEYDKRWNWTRNMAHELFSFIYVLRTLMSLASLYGWQTNGLMIIIKQWKLWRKIVDGWDGIYGQQTWSQLKNINLADKQLLKGVPNMKANEMMKLINVIVLERIWKKVMKEGKDMSKRKSRLRGQWRKLCLSILVLKIVMIDRQMER